MFPMFFGFKVSGGPVAPVRSVGARNFNPGTGHSMAAPHPPPPTTK